MRPLALLTLVAACSPETVARPAPPPVAWRSLETPPLPDAGRSTATENERAVADAYAKALGSPAFAGLAALLYEDAHFSFAGYRDAYGREDIIQAHETLLGAYDGRSVAIGRVLRTDSAQVVEWTMTGEHRASHRPVTFNGLVLLWTRDDGTIADIHLYFDEAVVEAELGDGPKALRGLPPPQPPVGRTEVEQAGSPEESANLAVLNRALDALENDGAAYAGAMADGVELRVLESAQPVRGQAVARSYWRAMQRAIARLDTQLDNGWGIGPYVVVEYHIVGEQRAPIAFVPVRKERLVRLFIVDVAELQGGKIAKLWRYDNPAQLASP